MNRLPIFAALAAASFSISSFAAVYRWVDGEGHVHYTDKAVENSTPVDVHTGQPRNAEPLPAGSNASGVTMSTGGGAVGGDQLAQKKSECEQKKKQYASYKNAARIVETDSLGRQHEYTADEQKQLVARAQGGMEETCKAAGISTEDANPPPATAQQ